MAQFTLNSQDVLGRLVSLSKRLADAIGWVGQQSRKITMDVPDELWQHGGGREIQFVLCKQQPIGVPCDQAGLPEERGEVELLLAILTKKRGKGTRPQTKERK